MRVPLLYPSAIVLHPLDISGTRAVDPPGPQPKGYDPYLREPVPYEVPATGEVADTRRYLPEVRIPCQVEVKTFEEVRQQVQGDAPVMNMTFVLHLSDLSRIGLLADEECACIGSGGPYTTRTRIKTNDKITAIEKKGMPGFVVQTFKEPLYVVQMAPGSWGMGPLGYDLEIVFVNNRPATDTSG